MPWWSGKQSHPSVPPEKGKQQQRDRYDNDINRHQDAYFIEADASVKSIHRIL